MTIDYEALAKAAYTGWCGYDPDDNNWTLYATRDDDGPEVRAGYVDVARAVIAAFRDQGMVVASAEDVREARAIVSIYKDRTRLASLTNECIALMRRLDAALAAPESAGEEDAGD